MMNCCTGSVSYKLGATVLRGEVGGSPVVGDLGPLLRKERLTPVERSKILPERSNTALGAPVGCILM